MHAPHNIVYTAKLRVGQRNEESLTQIAYKYLNQFCTDIMSINRCIMFTFTYMITYVIIEKVYYCKLYIDTMICQQSNICFLIHVPTSSTRDITRLCNGKYNIVSSIKFRILMTEPNYHPNPLKCNLMYHKFSTFGFSVIMLSCIAISHIGTPM